MHKLSVVWPGREYPWVECQCHLDHCLSPSPAQHLSLSPCTLQQGWSSPWEPQEKVISGFVLPFLLQVRLTQVSLKWFYFLLKKFSYDITYMWSLKYDVVFARCMMDLFLFFFLVYHLERQRASPEQGPDPLAALQTAAQSFLCVVG